MAVKRVLLGEKNHKSSQGKKKHHGLVKNSNGKSIEKDCTMRTPKQAKPRGDPCGLQMAMATSQ